MKIAIVLTCFNRKAKTLKCLEHALMQRGSDRVGLHFFITDDGSSDGTAEAIAAICPDAHILQGNGSLYWNGGMRLAWNEAMKGDADFFLWLNDDTFLYPNALHDMLDAHGRLKAGTGSSGIVVGSTDDGSGKLSYGGMVRKSGWRRLDMTHVLPNNDIQPCDTFNGNCVLISREAANVLGNLSPQYVHAMGDIDYGFRAKAANIPLVVMPSYAARCVNDHPGSGSPRRHRKTVGQQLKEKLSPKELPWRAWLTLCKRHTGMLWPLYWIWPYAKTFFMSFHSSLFVRRRGGAAR